MPYTKKNFGQRVITGVHDRLGLEGGNTGLDEEAHESELDVVLLGEVVLVLRSELHDGAHVALLEGREQSVVVLRLLESLGDLQPHSVHRLSSLASALLSLDGRKGRSGSRLRGGLRLGLGSLLLGLCSENKKKQADI